MTNQPPPFVDVNLYASDVALREAAAREGASAHAERISAFGERMGSAEVAEWARQAHAHPPELHAFDRNGNRIDEVEYHPAYHAMMTLGIEAGIAGAPWTGTANGHVLHAALEYLLAEIEPSTCCPITMTYASVATLRHEPKLAAQWEPLVIAQRYDPTLRPAREKAGVTIGMAMTEKQGGSDLRANTTRAERMGDAYALTGHKWFCSAPMSDAFLTLAQADGGLTCFLAPRLRPDGTTNAIHIMRLKDKAGDRANASSEIEYHGAHAIRVGAEGRGIATILDMVQHTRLDCAVAPAAYMRSALAQAFWFVSHRSAFGKRIADHALMQNVLADLALEAEAATALVFRLARSFDEAAASEEARAFSRIATPVAKYWLNKRVVGFVAEAMECHGGAGYIEEWPIARLFRQSPLNGIWEGSGNIVAIDMLRALSREPGARDAFLSELKHARGANRNLDAAITDLEGRLDRPDDADARALIEAMAMSLEAALLVRHGPAPIADGFCAARLAGRGWTYGALPPGTDRSAILARACPEA